jgi:hypothetical protein
MRLEAVGKRYGLRQPWIVKDVTMAVAAGKLIRLEGPNGSGKSTLLAHRRRGDGAVSWPGHRAACRGSRAGAIPRRADVSGQGLPPACGADSRAVRRYSAGRGGAGRGRVGGLMLAGGTASRGQLKRPRTGRREVARSAVPAG